MSDRGSFDFVPLWLLFALTVCVVSLAVEAGYRVGINRRQKPEHETDTPVGAIVGATLGLLAFMLAFTFGLAASRFDDRRQVVLDEANAIGTTYLRAGMLAEPQRGEVRKLLREYVDVRLNGVSQGTIDEVLSKSEKIHVQLWSHAEAAVRTDRSPITGLFVHSLNEVIDLHATRVQAGLRSRIPTAIWIALFFITILAMAAMGYQAGLSSSKRSMAALCLVLTFSAVMLLIADLDRPGEGLLMVSQQAMADLADSMKESN